LWKTHRLYPKQYELFLQEIGSNALFGHTNIPISGDCVDDPSSQSLDLRVSSQLCRCWTCERIRDDLPRFLYTTVPVASSPINEVSQSSLSPTSPEKAIASSLFLLSLDQLREIQDDIGFHRTVEAARSRGAALPTRPPTAKEKEMEKMAKTRQKEVGYLPGLNEYIEVLPDGRRKIRGRRMSMLGVHHGSMVLKALVGRLPQDYAVFYILNEISVEVMEINCTATTIQAV
jgi:hypothetical protein